MLLQRCSLWQSSCGLSVSGSRAVHAVGRLPYAQSGHAVATSVAVRCSKTCTRLRQARRRSHNGGYRRCSHSARHATASSQTAPQVILTREQGKNGKLAKALQRIGLATLEVPLVETAIGPDRGTLASLLSNSDFDWVVITSPEAANVFLQCWEQAGRPQARIAVVGQGTGDVLRAKQHSALNIEYTPEVANAVHLSAGLPHVEGGTQAVLYPASAKAGSDLQAGLLQRNFEVTRLTTYDTRPVQHLEPDVLEQACQASVVTFASPSAVKAWRKLTAGKQVDSIAVACIGSTTAIAAEKQGFHNVHYPEQPGIEGFVTAVTDALNTQQKQAVQV